MVLDIISVKTPAQLQAFINLPYELYRNDPVWRPPLRFERKAYMDVSKNPSLASLDYQLYVAKRDNKIVGRIAAFINKAHKNHHHDDAGHFGFLDCVSDKDIGQALIRTAEEWLKKRGAKKVVGPAQWSVNDECGMLVEGFQHPPVIMMSFGRADYPQILEMSGYQKTIDMFAFQADLKAGFPRPKMATRMFEYAKNHKSITSRPINMGQYEKDMALSMEVFNDAWSENWGFLPFTDSQVKHLADEMKPIILKDCFHIGYIDGEAAAFACMIPDLNEATKDLDGKLFPLGWAKLLYRLKAHKITQCRMPLMGLRKKWHNTRKGLALVSLLCETGFANAKNKYGFTHCELSWILEGNKGMISIAEQASAVHYKTYRMYEKSL